jgi:hypothetical protein
MAELAVEDGQRPGDQDADRPEHHAADHLDREAGVEEALVLAARALDDVRVDAEVRHHEQAHDERVDDAHQAEGLGEEQAGDDQVAAEAEDLLHGLADQADRRALDHPLLQGGRRRADVGRGGVGRLRRHEGIVGAAHAASAGARSVRTHSAWPRRVKKSK